MLTAAPIITSDNQNTDMESLAYVTARVAKETIVVSNEI